MAIEVQEVIQVPDKLKYVAFGDSVAGNTIIEYKDVDGKIDRLPFDVYFKTRVFNIIEFSDGTLRGLTSDKVKNIIGSKTVWSEVQYVYAHKVSKPCWQITTKKTNKFVQLTNDHSAIVLRSNKLQKVKPTDIDSTQDKLLVSIDNNCIVDEILDCKYIRDFNNEFVYDLSIDGPKDQHTFIANNILVSNTDSFGANIEPLVESLLKGKVPTKDWKREDVDKICQILDDKIIPLVNNNCAKIVKEKFLSDVSTIEFKREKFCGAACFLAKKHYAVYVLNNEGVSESTWIHKGTAIKQSALPKPIKEFLKLVVETGLLENWDNSKFMAICNDYYNEFKTYDILDISKSAGYSTEKVFRKPFDKTGVTAFGAIAANYYNDMINYLNLGHKYDKIRVGDKFRVAYVKPNNKWKLEYIGFPGVWPEEFNEYFEFDYKTMFAKYILKPLEGFMKVFKWKNPDFTKQAVINIDDL